MTESANSWPYCWCGGDVDLPFGPEYVRCSSCGTVVSKQPPPGSATGVEDDALDFYGESYPTEHQAALGLPTVDERRRADLSERCCYWLATLLRYRNPPARLLELGCSHGASTKLFAAAGFEATGLEMSPAVVEEAGRIFGIDVRVGPLENVADLGTVDIVASFDVVEHLPDPIGTLGELRRTIRPGGLLLVQTPNAPEAPYEELARAGDRFLEHLKPAEHVYLFTKSSMRRLLNLTGFPVVNFEEPIFDYDMFYAASDASLERREDDPQNILDATGDTRIVRALLDAVDRERAYHEAARARMAVIEQLKATCDERLALIETLDRALKERATAERSKP